MTSDETPEGPSLIVGRCIHTERGVKNLNAESEYVGSYGHELYPHLQYINDNNSVVLVCGETKIQFLYPERSSESDDMFLFCICVIFQNLKKLKVKRSDPVGLLASYA
jgi:hypothetical protein